VCKKGRPKKALEIALSRKHNAFETGQIGRPGELWHRLSADVCERGRQSKYIDTGSVSLERIDDGHVGLVRCENMSRRGEGGSGNSVGFPREL